MSYLDRLRAIESGTPPEGEPTEPTKAPSVGFVGTPPAHIQNIQGAGFANDGDQESEAWRQHLLAVLAENPNIRRAVQILNPHSDPVIVAIAIRDVATFQVAIPAARFDAFKLLELTEQDCGGTVH